MYNKHMEFFKRHIGILIFIFFVLAVPIFVTYADTKFCDPGKICNPIPSVSTLSGLIKILLEGVIKVGLPLLVLAIIYCGFLFVQARGNPEEITKAKDALLYTMIGAGVILGSWAIAQLITNTVINLS